MRLLGRINRLGPALLNMYTNDGSKLIAGDAHCGHRICLFIEKSHADNVQSLLIEIPVAYTKVEGTVIDVVNKVLRDR